jgi:hypothetical protein
MAVYGAVSLNVAANVAEFQIIHIISVLKGVHTLLTFTDTLNFTQIPETPPVYLFSGKYIFPLTICYRGKPECKKAAWLI